MRPRCLGGRTSPSCTSGFQRQKRIFSYRGGAYSRAGTSFVGYSKQTGRAYPPRTITFQFNINQGLALEFGNYYMRVVFNGGFVLEPAVAITALTNANPAVLTTAAISVAGALPVNSSVTASYNINDQITLVGGTQATVLKVDATQLASPCSFNGPGQVTFGEAISVTRQAIR